MLRSSHNGRNETNIRLIKNQYYCINLFLILNVEFLMLNAL
jgi:hypothetical protein